MREWRKVPDWPYEISDFGDVRRADNGRPRKSVRHKLGYMVVKLNSNRRYRTFYINRLVCELFHGPPPSAGYHAAHLDGDVTNNYVGNLCWVTPKENTAHKRGHGTFPSGDQQPRRVLSSASVAEMRKRYDELPRTTTGRVKLGELIRLAAEYGVHKTTIYAAVKGKSWRNVV